MTTQHESYQKWRNDFESDYDQKPSYFQVWQAATTEANKRMAELEVQLQNWKDFSKKVQKIDFNDYLQLQASNNHLRELLKRTSSHYYLQKEINEALSATPAESLAKHDDEVIEKCAHAAKIYRANVSVVEAIRALKGK